MSANFEERPAWRQPFKGITANGQIETGLFAIRSTGVSTEPVRKAAEALLASISRRSAPRRRSRWTIRMAQVDEPGLLHPPGRQLPGDERRAARSWDSRCCAPRSARRAQADARHHAPEPHARRADTTISISLRRMALPHHRHGQAVRDRAVGLAARRPPPHHQLLRPGRSGGDDAVLRRLRAGDRADRASSRARPCCRTSRTRASR